MYESFYIDSEVDIKPIYTGCTCRLYKINKNQDKIKRNV